MKVPHNSDGRWCGVFAIAPTPFNPDESLDLESIRTLVDFYVSHGVSGLTILGVMGEAHKLLADERLQVIDAFIQAVDGRMPVVVGTTHPGTQPAIRLARQAEQRGAAGLLVAPPLVTGPQTNEQLVQHYQAISSAVSIPIAVQDYPPTSGVELGPQLLADMARSIERVQYLKLEDSPTIAKLGQIRQLAGGNLIVFGGLGGTFFLEELDEGAQGTMTGFAFPEILVSIYDAHVRGDVNQAADIFYRSLPLIRFEFQPGIALAVRKEVLRRRGAIRFTNTRGPSWAADEATDRALTLLLSRLQLN